MSRLDELRAIAECHGEDNILNPLISEWRTGTSPARLIELLGDKADEKRLDLFGRECDFLLSSRAEFTVRPSDSGRWYWATMQAWEHQNCTVKPHEACAIIRCLWPNPVIQRERVECQACTNSSEYEFCHTKGLMVYTDYEMHRTPCRTCNGIGEIEAPIIDQRWLSLTVIDLAMSVCGRESGWYCENCGRENGTADFWCYCGDKGNRIKSPAEQPRPELMPILGDALMDAGCDSEEVIEHCQSEGLHVGGCWVIDAIMSRV